MTVSLPMASAGISAAALTGLLLLLGGVGGRHSPDHSDLGSGCPTIGTHRGDSGCGSCQRPHRGRSSCGKVGDQAALIPLMTGFVEPELRVLANPSDPAGHTFPGQGMGSDHASLGIFQQQPWWPATAARMEPAASTNIFLGHPLAIPNWQAAPP